MAQENVVAINGGPLPFEADPNVVERLEQLLDLARNGQIVGLAFVWVEANDGADYTGWGRAACAPFGVGMRLLGGLGVLQHRIAKYLAE